MIEIGPSVLTVTVTSFTPSSIAKRLIGSFTVSPHESWRGIVASSISGERTVTLLSALPYEPLFAATTITRTEPTYIGKVILWLFVPLLSVNGPKNLTTGLNRFSLPAARRKASSPPILNIDVNLPP